MSVNVIVETKVCCLVPVRSCMGHRGILALGLAVTHTREKFRSLACFYFILIHSLTVQ